MKWGRNIVDNVRKFLQFQLTVNLSCLLIVILGGISTGMSPFNVIQLLWINLVMDVLAAIALATEAPEQDLSADRIKKNDRFITPVMWRTILSQVIYQFIVMIIMLYAGPAMFNIRYNLISTELRTPSG